MIPTSFYKDLAGMSRTCRNFYEAVSLPPESEGKMALSTTNNLYRIRPEIWNELLSCQRMLLNDQIFNRLQCVERGYNFPLTYCFRRKPGLRCQECIYKIEGLADEIGIDYQPMSLYSVSPRYGWRCAPCEKT